MMILIKEAKQVMHNPIAHHALTNAQPAPRHLATTSQLVLPGFVIHHDAIRYGISL